MKEIEVKVLDINTKDIIQKLKKLKAKKTFEDEIEATFFDYPNNTFKKNNQLLRLRKKGNLAELTLKRNISRNKAKIVEETERVVDFNKTLKFLKSLGLVEVRKLTKKYRISYQLKNIHFEIDKVEGIPAYLEIEAQSLNHLEKALKLLNIPKSKAKPWTQTEVQKFYKK